MKNKDYNLSRTEWITLIDEWILSERDRKIMKRRIIDGVSYERLAEEFGLSTQRVNAIISRCKTILLSHI